jgi:tetratricopeptide (TPR) repeat protein
MTLPGWIAALLGMVILVRRHRLFGGFCAVLTLLSSFGLLLFLKFDLEREELFTARVFLMPAYLILGLGFAAVAARLLEALPGTFRFRLAPGLLALPAVLAATNWAALDRSRYFWVEDYGRAILEKLPKDCVLFPGGDTSTFPLLYLQSCEGVRRDVLIIDRWGSIEREPALELLPEAARETYRSAPAEVLTDAVIGHASRPVVMLRRHSLPDAAEITFEPYGFGHVAVKGGDRKNREALREFQGRFLKEIAFRNEKLPTIQDYTADVIRCHLVQVKAAWLFRSGDPPAAVRVIARAEAFGAGIKETLNNTGALLAENGHPELAEPRFRKALQIRGDYHLARRNLVLTLRTLRRPNEAIEEASWRLALVPKDRMLFEQAVQVAMEVGDGRAVHALCATRMKAAPDDPAPDRYLARWALDHEGSAVLAQGHLQSALAKDPKDRESKDVLESLDARLGMPAPLETGEESKDRLGCCVACPQAGLVAGNLAPKA